MKIKNFPAFLKIAVCLTFVTLNCQVSKAQSPRSRPQKQKAELYVQTGHSTSVSQVLFSPDGQTLASGSYDKTIKLWDAEAGQELRTLTSAYLIRTIAFSSDGKTLASGSSEGIIQLWNVETGQEIRKLAAYDSEIDSIAFSLDGKTLAACSPYGGDSIKLWNVKTGQKLRSLTGSDGSFHSLAFSPDGKTLASGGPGTGIRLWDAKTGQELRTFGAGTSVFVSLAFSPDGKTLASDGDNNTIKLWNVEIGREIKTLNGEHTYPISSLAFSPDGKTLASGSNDGVINQGITSDDMIKLWNVETGQEIKTLTGLTRVDSVTFSPDGKTLASDADNNTIKLWNVETGQEVKTLTSHTSDISAVAFSPDGKILASSYENDETVKLWNIAKGQELRTLTGNIGNVNSVAFSPDGKILASGDSDEIKLWNVETGQELRTLKVEYAGNIISLAFSPDGKTLASIYEDDGRILLWNVESGQKLKPLAGHGLSGVYSIAFSPDGKTLASGDSDEIKLWNVETGQELRTLKAKAIASVGSLAFSPDGKTLASGDYEGMMLLWSVESGQQIRSLNINNPNALREVHSLVPDYTSSGGEAITRDGRYQIKAGANGKIDLYDFKTGKLLASLITFDKIDWAVITPDGLFDGSPAAWRLLSWRLSNRLHDIAPIEAFYNEFYRPGLLQDIFAGKQIERPTRDISAIDIRQPKVEVKMSNAEQNATNISARRVTIKVEVTAAPPDQKRRTTSGARDVRLFRNGSLIKVWRGNVLGGSRSVTLTATVTVVAGDNSFTAYAFNNENVKSRDAELRIKGADSLKRKGTAYVLTIGVDKYDNSQYNLRYAVADAQVVGKELKLKQQQLGIYEPVEVIELTNENATKEKIIKTLIDLQSRTQPEDAVIVFFAGHGTAQGNRFYLLPHDLGYRGDRNKLDAAGLKLILERSISDKELEAAFEGIDAGQLLMVLDACNSGQALEAEEKRRGPMNSKGLAQLAYEKGMYILTAAQSYQAAKESSEKGHGLLTYALIEEGLKQPVADSEPPDGKIMVREWFDYATRSVPEMQVKKMKAARAAGLDLSFKEEERNAEVEQRTAQQPRVFYRRELEQQPFIVARSGASQLKQ
jgi:WD40 repeat protein